MSSSRARTAQADTEQALVSPPADYAAALDYLYSYFTVSGTAYTYGAGTAVPRYYCTACLKSEVVAVRSAREKYGQGQNAPAAVLEGIAKGRIEFFYPSAPAPVPAEHAEPDAPVASTSAARAQPPPRNDAVWMRVRVDSLLRHIIKDCPFVRDKYRKEIRARCAVLTSALGDDEEDDEQDEQTGDATASAAANRFDFGSVFEVTRYPKYAGRNLELLVPGAASPGQIFKSHEGMLLRRAKRRRDSAYITKERKEKKQRRKEEKRERKRARAESKGKGKGKGRIDFDLDPSLLGDADAENANADDRQERQEREDEDSSDSSDDASQTDDSSSEDGQEDTLRQGRRHKDPDIEARLGIDEQLLYGAVKEQLGEQQDDGDGDDTSLPEGFPESDLLKMLRTHAGTLYTERGLMSTAAHPEDPLTGTAIPSMIQALDGSALIALGILTQEFVRSAVLPPAGTVRPVQPVSDLLVVPGHKRREGRRGWEQGAGRYMTQRTKAVTDKILRRLGEGSEVGIRDLTQACASAAGEKAGPGAANGSEFVS